MLRSSPQFLDRIVTAVEEQLIIFVERLEALVGTPLRNRRKIETMSRMQEDELTLVVFLQREETGRLTLLLACFDGFGLNLVTGEGIQFGGGDDAVAFPCAFDIGGTGEGLEQSPREW